MTEGSIENIWGEDPCKHEWLTRVDERVLEEPDEWIQSACVLCRYDRMQLSTAYGRNLD